MKKVFKDIGSGSGDAPIGSGSGEKPTNNGIGSGSGG